MLYSQQECENVKNITLWRRITIMTDSNENNPASAIPKRTIKLKPTAPGAAAPTLKLKPTAAPSAPAAPDAAASAPTIKLTSPAPAPAAGAVSTDTAKLARRTIKLVPQSGSPLAGPATAPATPVTTNSAASPALAANTVPTDTAKLSKRTIKLTPASGAPAASAPSAPAAPGAAASAPTIKLTSPAPSPAADAVSTDTAKLSKRTIKLTPASGAGATANKSAAGAAPSAPTIKLGAPAAPSAPTIKLTQPKQTPAPESEVPTDTSKIDRQPAAESTPGIGGETVKLRPQSQQTIRLTPSAGGLQLKKPVAKTGLAAAEAPQELTNKLAGVKPAEDSTTNMICLISSIVALLLLGFTCFVMYAQHSNFFSGSDINVPGLTRLTGASNGN